jgi:enamine deaminase RidA (YjgF/YER057c/UK114 family)
MTQRQNFTSGGAWEVNFGYSRAVRIGNHIAVSGTTAGGADGEAASDDAYEQTKVILNKIIAVLAEAGGRPQDIVRTRAFVTNIEDLEAVGRAHGEVFAEICPCATMVEITRLVSPDLLVEIEADAILSDNAA